MAGILQPNAHFQAPLWSKPRAREAPTRTWFFIGSSIWVARRAHGMSSKNTSPIPRSTAAHLQVQVRGTERSSRSADSCQRTPFLDPRRSPWPVSAIRTARGPLSVAAGARRGRAPSVAITFTWPVFAGEHRARIGVWSDALVLELQPVRLPFGRLPGEHRYEVDTSAHRRSVAFRVPVDLHFDNVDLPRRHAGPAAGDARCRVFHGRLVRALGIAAEPELMLHGAARAGRRLPAASAGIVGGGEQHWSGRSTPPSNVSESGTHPSAAGDAGGLMKSASARLAPASPTAFMAGAQMRCGRRPACATETRLTYKGRRLSRNCGEGRRTVRPPSTWTAGVADRIDGKKGHPPSPQIMAAQTVGRPPLRFGLFEFRPDSRELRKGRMKLRLQDQPLDFCSPCSERPGELVTRDELRARLWATGPSRVQRRPQRGDRTPAARPGRLGREPAFRADGPAARLPLHSARRRGRPRVGRAAGRPPRRHLTAAPPLLDAVAAASWSPAVVAWWSFRSDDAAEPPRVHRTTALTTGAGPRIPAELVARRHARRVRVGHARRARRLGAADRHDAALVVTRRRADDSNPAWSPDGLWIAFATTRTAAGSTSCPR